MLQKKIFYRRQLQWRHKRNKVLREVGLELLDNLFSVALNLKVPVWMEFGTLLGAYREHSFISHDFDIDCSMFAEDYTMYFENELLALGFVKKRVFYCWDKNQDKKFLTEVTFDYKNISIDIFLSFRDNCEERVIYAYEIMTREESLKNNYRVQTWTLPSILELSTLKIDNHSYPAPTNAKEILEVSYGRSFMTPIPCWKAPEGHPCCKDLPFDEFVGIMKGSWDE